MGMAYNGFLALGKETTRGTTVARTKFIRFASCDITEEANWIPNQSSQDRYIHEAYAGNFDVGLNAQIEVRPDNVGEILRSLMWADPVKSTPGGATNARDHTFKPPASGTTPTIKPYSAEVRYGTANVAELVGGTIFDEATFQWDRQTLQAAVAGFGKKPEDVAPTSSPSYTSTRPFVFHEATVSLFGSTRAVRSGNIRLANGSTRDWSSGSRYTETPEAGMFANEMAFTMVFSDMNDIKRFWGGTGQTSPDGVTKQAQYAVNVKFVGDEIESSFNYQIEFDWQKAGIVNVGKPQQAGNQIIQTINMMGQYDAGTSRPVQVVVRNDNDTGY